MGLSIFEKARGAKTADGLDADLRRGVYT